MSITILSLRAGLHWPSPVSCIQDAFFGALSRWFRQRGEAPGFWNVSWSAEKPKRADAAVLGAEWIFLLSSNEFLFHGKNDAINPMFVKASDQRIAKLKPLLRGKRVVLFTMDAKDTAELIRDETLAGAELASFDTVSECDFPLTIQTMRYEPLRALGLSLGNAGARPLDFAYWGTTKRYAPGGLKSGDARYGILREVLARSSLAVWLSGNHFGKVRAKHRFDTCLANLVPELTKARATCCFQWPGHGDKLTARYHEALALGIIPFVHADYDTERQVAPFDWQRVDSHEALFRRLLENREPGVYRQRLAEVREIYLAAKPSDEAQVARLSERLSAIMTTRPTELAAEPAPPAVEPDWTRGYPLARLKSAAAVFKARHKPLVFGAFGLVKERDIAAALADNELAWRGPDAEPRAVAIVRRMKAPGGFVDFAQRSFPIPAGHVKVSDFAALDVSNGVAVLAALAQRAARRLWVEIFEEDEIARACLDKVPELHYRATRIAAGSEIKGVYSNVPNGGGVGLHPAEAAALVEIERGFCDDGERTAMLAEVDAYAEWEQHYSSYNKRQSWTAFALRGYGGGDPHFIIKPAEMSKAWKAENPERMKAKPEWTGICERFPVTLRCVYRILAGRNVERVRLMRLAPGGELSRHADITNRDAGLADGMLARLHVPLRTSHRVIFHGWDKRGRHIQQQWREGALYYLDQRGPHRVENRDPACERVHLVLDVHSDAALREAIAANPG